ncbi:MAG: anti-sigma factor family protein [Arachnia sp.]
MTEVPPSDCERYRQDLSAFFDETLAPRRWEQVGYHVAGCPICRLELETIQDLRRSLRAPADDPSGVSHTLSERLNSIAGEHIDAPLYMAGGPKCALPSRRKRRNRRILRSTAAVMTTLASVLVIAFLVSPEPPTVTNAVALAREDFLLSTTALSVNDAVGAVLLAHERGATLDGPQHQSARATMVYAPQRITSATASALLTGTGITHSGVQRVWISDDGAGFHVTDVSVDEVAGEGTSLVVLDSSGNRFESWFVPSNVCCESEEGPPWSFWRYGGMDQVAGRWAEVIEARDEDGNRVARWWVDLDGGLILWSERYDEEGKPTIISGFTSLTMGEAHLSQPNSQLIGMNPVSSSGAKGWCHGLTHCPASLGGLPLVAHSSADVRGGTSMKLFYSDGFRSLSVVWSSGQLHDTTRITDHAAGLPEVAIWQSGEGIVSVATSGSVELVHDASQDLPGELAWEPSMMERIGRGLSRLAGIN